LVESGAWPGSPEIAPDLKISLRIPESLLAELKLLANKRDVPYQSLMKTFLAERVRDELNLNS
jgi:predicted DNA binding CopG/RHH family protein